MRSLGGVVAAGFALLVFGSSAASAAIPSVPILGPETPIGTHVTKTLKKAKTTVEAVDGSPADWAGTPAGYGGATVRSHGELIYTDHLFDAYGADDGRDKERLDRLAPVYDNVPEAYRLEPLIQYGSGELGLPLPEQFNYQTHFGDLGMQDRADLTEFRVTTHDGQLWLLGRVTTMTAPTDTGLLVLLDTVAGGARRTVPFKSGLHTDTAEWALLLSGGSGRLVNLVDGSETALPAGSVATDPSGWTNAIEAAVTIPGLGDSVGVSAATGRMSGADLANVANVAFRSSEPVRENWEKQQALALLDGSIDSFAQTVDLKALAHGANERWIPRRGFHERIFTSTEAVARESGEDGLLQPYDVWVPSAYREGRAAPLQLWLHWRGGNNNSVGNVAPRVLDDLGEARGALVVSPRGRGSSSWYVGRGQVDIEDVWRDVHETFTVDRRRTYTAGHSMGGWGSFLLTILHPDRFAAALPASPPVTQGAWTGVDFDGCDDYTYDEYSPCYVQANGGDARAQHTRRLLENVRHVPWAMYAGVEDELVPFSGVARQDQRLVELGYRHRLYAFLTQEHYGPPIWDQWAEGARYMDRFRAPRNPRQVTYKRDMPFERATERVNNGGVALNFDFDHAYWMSGLEPVDAVNGVASFDGTSLAIADKPHLLAPEAGGPAAEGNEGPYVMAGLQWLRDPLTKPAATANAFTLTLTGTKAVTLNAKGMKLDPAKTVTGTVTSDHELALTLHWPGRTETRTVAAGTHTVTLAP